jgi:HK97 family phage major capsid protein
MTIDEMRDSRKALLDQASELQAKADAESRDLTQEEAEQQTELLAQVRELGESIDRRAELEGALRQVHEDATGTPGANRKCDPAGPKASENDTPTDEQRGRTPTRVHERWRDDPALGWRSFGQFLQGVAEGCMHERQRDDRLTRALSTYGSEGVSSDGGFAIPPGFLSGIRDKCEAESSLLPRTEIMNIEGNTMRLPKSEVTPWGSSGPQAYWGVEAGSMTQSKPLLEKNTLELNKLYVLVPLTEELLEDAPALESWVTRWTGVLMSHKIDLAIYQGTGVGTPLGMLNAPATVSVAKETSQTADTVVANNVLKMWSRLYAPWRGNAVWLANQDVEPQLLAMYGIDAESTQLSTWPVYLPQGGLSAQPYSTLLGRPVIFTQVCETLGDKGDIMLCDLAQYLSVQKAGGIKVATSVHLWFDQDTTAFKATWRMDGQPMWSSTIAARDGSNTYSAYVTLAERA